MGEWVRGICVQSLQDRALVQRIMKNSISELLPWLRPSSQSRAVVKISFWKTVSHVFHLFRRWRVEGRVEKQREKRE